MGWLSSFFLIQACLPMGGCWQDFICWSIHNIMLCIQIGGSLQYRSSSTFCGFLKCLDLWNLDLPLWLAGTNLCWGHWCWGAWRLGHDAWGLDAMGLDKEPNALELDSMEHGKDPDAMESDDGPEVLGRNLLAWALLSWPLLSELWGGSTGVKHAHLDRSAGIWENFWWKGASECS